MLHPLLQNVRDRPGDRIPGESLSLLHRPAPTASLASLRPRVLSDGRRGGAPLSPPSPATSSTLVRLLSRARRRPSVSAQVRPRADLRLLFRDPDGGSLN
jgi:hypothetical protein